LFLLILNSRLIFSRVFGFWHGNSPEARVPSNLKVSDDSGAFGVVVWKEFPLGVTGGLAVCGIFGVVG
jgi:hypothetical protein